MTSPQEPINSNVHRVYATDWMVRRHGIIDEVEEETPDGTRIRFRVKIWDVGRQAFITQWFNDYTPAHDFLERVKLENTTLSGGTI